MEMGCWGRQELLQARVEGLSAVCTGERTDARLQDKSCGDGDNSSCGSPDGTARLSEGRRR